MKNSKKVSLMVILLLVLTLPMSAMAHGGRTDGAGGHRDNKNASGLGYYHYHCGGNPPHLHSGGGCPYSSTAVSKPAPAKSKPAPAKAPTYDIKLKEYVYNNNSSNMKSFVHGDRTYIAAADLSDLIGGTANYDKSIKTVTISSPATYKTVSFAVDNKTAIITQDRTYVPLRSAIETMGYTVDVVDKVMVLNMAS